MYKTPPRDDEQPEYQPQRRRRSLPSQRPSVDYHYDEHPEIPKIRRASLHVKQQSIQLPPETTALQAVAEKKPKQAVRPYHPSGLVDDDEVAEKKPKRPYHYQYDPDSLMVVRQPKHRVHEPPPTAHRLRHTHSQRSLYIQLQHLSHNRSVLVIMCLLLMVVIGVPILNATHSQTTNGLGNVTTNGNTSSAKGQQLTDPHELIITPQDTDHPAPPVFATSAYLLDADTGATLYAQNPFMHLPMLSTTKLMTAVLAVEHGKLDQNITINDTIDRDVSQLSADSATFGFKKGETYTLRDMLYALLLVSGNDAAIAIADTIGGDQANFVAEMNSRAHQLGLYDTHYRNPHGLLATGQYSTAHDLAVLGRYTMGIPLLHQISGTQIYRMPQGGNHPERIIVNGNQFLFWYPGVDGGKTGYDPGDADFIQVVSTTRNGHHLIGVVMHTVNWWTDMRDLMNWGFDSFTWISPYDVDFHTSIPFDDLWNYFADDKKDNTVPTPDKGRYYVYTGFSISGPILTYFDQVGGLKKFGYPLSLQTVSSSGTVSERFEHSSIQCDLTTKVCSTV